jgi:hypothetical protein
MVISITDGLFHPFFDFGLTAEGKPNVWVVWAGNYGEPIVVGQFCWLFDIYLFPFDFHLSACFSTPLLTSLRHHLFALFVLFVIIYILDSHDAEKVGLMKIMAFDKLIGSLLLSMSE